MPDYPGVAKNLPHIVLSTVGENSLAGQAAIIGGVGLGASAVWPAANRAIYVPIVVEVPVTVLKMAFIVAVQNGNYDIGIYDYLGNRLVSTGSTAVPAAGIAIADIADTILMPGVYFFALCIDNTTASVQRVQLPGTTVVQICGIQQQAVGAVTLPNPATFANPASNYVPMVVATTVATI